MNAKHSKTQAADAALAKMARIEREKQARSDALNRFLLQQEAADAGESPVSLWAVLAVMALTLISLAETGGAAWQMF